MTSFERDYFINSERSNFKDYLSKKFDKQADDLLTHTPLSTDMRVLDFGCGAGGLVAELRKRGLKDIEGTDISRWAIKKGKENGLDKYLCYFNMDKLTERFDFIIFQDVLEHIPTEDELLWCLEVVRVNTYVYIRVPVSAKEGENFVLEVSRNDATHFQCHTKNWWHERMIRCGYAHDRYGVIHGEAIYESEGVLARVYQKVRA